MSMAFLLEVSRQHVWQLKHSKDPSPFLEKIFPGNFVRKEKNKPAFLRMPLSFHQPQLHPMGHLKAIMKTKRGSCIVQEVCAAANRFIHTLFGSRHNWRRR
ncbi:hypothetical protein TNCV_1786441 [Trichonephila clavipes]|nr:hypothetical protein TNCV_1786441 [Trichonephila clavipes]